MTTNHKAEIVKSLEAICFAGRKTWTVTEDWLDIVLATLTMLPAHALSVATTGKPAEDTPEVKTLWARLNKVYERSDWDNFKNAFHLLTDCADVRAREWESAENLDVLGEIYMETNISSKHSGQYFTPWEVAKMMAIQTVGDREAARAELATRTMFNPMTVHDCACGSGIMLLAAATCFPREDVYRRRVMFYGQDADATCVKIARINMMLYGMNGWGSKWDSATTVLRGCGIDQANEPTDDRPAPDYELPIGQLALLHAVDGAPSIVADVPARIPGHRRNDGFTVASAAPGLFDQ